MVLRADVPEIGLAKSGLINAKTQARLVQLNQVVGLAKGQRLNKGCVEDAEDDGAGADAGLAGDFSSAAWGFIGGDGDDFGGGDGGAAVGGAVGGITGALIGLGIPEYEAKRYEGRVRSGGVLLSVHCDTSAEIDRAEKILKATGAEDISSTSESAHNVAKA